MRKHVFWIISLIILCACEGASFRSREKGALIGGATGAGLGAIIGHQTGKTGAGIAIGSAIGALGGALAGNEVDAADDRIAVTEDRIQTNERLIAENQRLINELKNRGADAYRSDRGVVVNLPDVLFEFDRSDLRNDARRTVGDIADVLRSTGNRRIAVEGHTDSVGTISYNRKLSQDRARTVANALVSSGISRRRIVSRGFGESDPIASNQTERGRARNRRVEVIIEN